MLGSPAHRTPDPTPERTHDRNAADAIATAPPDQTQPEPPVRRGRPVRRPGRWRGMAGDVVVVVLGILIAFALDPWWGRRAAAAREQAHLRALHGDFTRNLERLRRDAELEERIAAGSHRLLVLAHAGEVPPADTLWRLLSIVFTSTRFEPVMGAYEAVVSSGGLTQIRDDTLRVALAGFSATLATRYVEEYTSDLYLAFIRDYTGRLPFLVEGVISGAEPPAPGSAVARSTAALLRDPRFQAHLALRYAAERDAARHYRRLAARAEAILARIEGLLEP